jgi:hypothetical protein
MGFRALWGCRALLAALLALPLGGCGMATSISPAMTATPGAVSQAKMCVVAATLPATKPTASLPPFMLHLPGIGGERNIDVYMTRGFKEGGFKGDVQIYDWTTSDKGIDALLALKRNHEQAKLIAGMLTERFDKDPTAPMYLSGHSGGGAVAVWALEALPERVKVNSLLLMSNALSPTYDLTPALRHVSGKAYVFSSYTDDLVLGLGCRLLGTMDGVKTDAAGRIGFTMPPTGDAGQYAKLVPMPYHPEWKVLDDMGDHVGGMRRRFARMVLAPLLLSGKMPPTTAEAADALAGRASKHG